MSKRKTITKRMSSKLEIVTTNTGFTVWIRDGKHRHWVIDGSCIKDDGIVRIGSYDGYRHRAEWDKEEQHIRITRKP